MNKPIFEVADILRQTFAGYNEAYGPLPTDQYKVAHAIMACRTSILHTWGQNLMDHPHLHCVIPGGALMDNGRWKQCRKNFLFPVKPLSALFKGKLLDYFKKAVASGNIELCGRLQQYKNPAFMKTLMDSLYKDQWVVYVKPPFAGPKAVVKYTGRYTHRVAISNNRLVAVNEKSVTFKWKDYRDHNRQKRMNLNSVEFIRRFMLHVIPSGFVRIRHYGFLSNRSPKKRKERKSSYRYFKRPYGM